MQHRGKGLREPSRAQGGEKELFVRLGEIARSGDDFATTVFAAKEKKRK